MKAKALVCNLCTAIHVITIPSLGCAEAVDGNGAASGWLHSRPAHLHGPKMWDML